MTTKIAFVRPLTYQMSKNLFNPTMKYCTIGPNLQSRCHQHRLLSLSRRDTQSQKGHSPKTATRNEFRHIRMYTKSTTQLNTVRNWSLLLHKVLICFEEATNQARSFHAAMETATRIRPFHHYYTHGVVRNVSNPDTSSIISMV